MAYYKLDPNTGKWQAAESAYMPYTFKDRQDNSFTSAVKVYKLALIGVGSSIAYYLNALGAPYVSPPKGSRQHNVVPPSRPMDRHAIVFGSTDAWDASVRGDGFINHEQHLIGQWGAEVVEFSPDYMERAEFAGQNRDVFQRAIGVEPVKAEVTKISRFGHLFKVYAQERFYLAQKVVVGVGAGPHQRPRTMVVHQDAWNQVRDLDEFMRANPRGAPTLGARAKVVVNGANAGIDAVERAASLGYDVTWFIGQKEPAILPGNRLRFAPELARSAISVDYDIRVDPAAENRITITYKQRGNQQTSTMTADRYVFALGQDPMAQGAVGDVLITQGGLTEQDFEPLYDVNQVYGEPFQTVLGLQVRELQAARVEFKNLNLPETTSERGLLVIGAAATSLAGNKRAIAHNFREQFTPHLPQPATQAEFKAYQQQQQLISRAESYLQNKTVAASLEGVVRYDVGSVLQHAQLVGVRGAVAAMTGFAPEYLEKGVNLSSDNRSMLRVYLAQAFPDLDEALAQKFIYRVMAQRKEQPIGYTPKQTRELFREFAKEYLGQRFPDMKKDLSTILHPGLDLSRGGAKVMSALEKGRELQSALGGQITSVRKRAKKSQVTLSLTPSRYKL
ncbi:type III effector HopAD1 [Cystobacter fuscus DSM 2262]|uniref:Type III effector HopAD1 n=1 Tax=Cystobacter fuscus (strain ATCC 25194 / DSM 2262 / NBRC 100088 / M29) TaxID=1242864 RepID=S9P5Z3_CYSF2|nr:hypothetical protein [Cystobacter fuscus]EPX57632.1 type III effector HopAD1 [Cystobacter fuscus DSM 2262]